MRKNNVESNNNKLKLRRMSKNKRNKTTRSFKCRRVVAMAL